MPESAYPNHPTDVLGGFIWLVSEYRRTFLGLIVVLTMAPLAMCVFLLAVMVGSIESPLLNAIKDMNEQHQLQYKRLSENSQAISDAQKKVDGTYKLVDEIVKGNEKNFKGQVANCFVAANGAREAIDRCKELQRLE